jgi:tripartite-type tricarboxylate transporter receptor subunit TctC
VGIQFNAKGTTETTNGMIAPRGLAKDIIKKYELALEQAGKSAEFLNTLQTIGCDPHFTSGENYRKEIEEGYKQVAELIKKLGLK